MKKKTETKQNKWIAQLQKLEGAVVGDYNPFSNVIRTPSPSVNFIFGDSWGLPKGFTAILYGPPASGKTLLVNAMAGQYHKDDPEGIVIKFDTELREMGQMTEKTAAMWGIDRSRYLCYSTNSPMLIFDRIEKEIDAMCQDGAPVGLIIIDSITGIMGRRGLTQDSIEKQQIGDEALTLQVGLKRILPVLRKHKIALLLTAHVRAEMDQMEAKIGYNKSSGPTVKMGASWATKHTAEYFIFVEENRTKDGRTDLLGNEMIDKTALDIYDKPEKLGHKIRVTMKKSSFGGEGRMGEFTLSYRDGIINQHEEVFLLGLNRGVIGHPSNPTYTFGDKKWTSKAGILQALKDSTDLQSEILKELRRKEDTKELSLQDSLFREDIVGQGEGIVGKSEDDTEELPEFPENN